ncbi:MAG TPA: DUF1343 domain-containing protein [Planctomycetes bacterium]|nr:DUF1343 domain-containing protein [Planctomycetota bacterium]HIK59585.1 DUF1343 domain-containing protein [Planctomycetota bacterium]
MLTRTATLRWLVVIGGLSVHGVAQSSLLPAVRLLDQAVQEAVIPGAVLHVGQGGAQPRMAPFMHASGALAVAPEPEVMRPDAIFDLASLTKPVATATAIMILVERGELSLEAPVADYFPAFGDAGKSGVTVEHLLLHRSGLTADNPIDDYLAGRAEALKRVCALDLLSAPGAEFRYSDVGFILLGWLVEEVDGRPLEVFCAEEIFTPLGMRDTTFRPSLEIRQRCAPTGVWEGRWLRGEVHDPRARALGGVAGHAGLFSTARDLGRWTRMLLAGGAWEGKHILAPDTVARMLKASWLPDGSGGRALGLDVDSVYSSPRGDLFPRGRSLGHSGFTGPALWFDLESEVYVVFLCSRLHPHSNQSVIGLRREVSTAVARAFLAPADPIAVRTGVDVLARDSCAALAGQRVGLLTHSAGRTGDGMRTLDLLAAAPEVDLVRVFTPEHGMASTTEGHVPDEHDDRQGVPILSLYGEHRRPELDDLDDLDTVVVDLQDVGVRFYTYATTVGYLMEACAKTGTAVLVLDRPNPIAFLGPRGPRADGDRVGFISYQPTPVAHGLTLGELCLYFRSELGLEVDLQVVAMEGWMRDMSWEDTGLPWRNPSPNLRNTRQALLYPMVGLLEGCNLSVGRGCDEPFEQFGAPWITGGTLAADLNDLGLPGVRFVDIEFTPRSSRFKGEVCAGVHLVVTDERQLTPVLSGLALAWQLDRGYSRSFRTEQVDDRLVNHGVWESMRRASDPLGLGDSWAGELAAYWLSTEPFRLYSDGPQFVVPR